MATVTLRGVRKQYGQVDVINGIDLEVRDGEFMVFVGPSGCGKSTTLRMIAGLESISAGTLEIDGVRCNDTRPSDRGAAMVFQSYALYPHMTVADNMGFALRMAGVKRTERQQAVGRAAEILRIQHLLDRYPKQLSGGERQRVAIGRAIVRKPKVFLFDEPLSNLDAALRVSMRIELMRLHRELGTTMIYVTHDQVEAMTMGDRIAVFNRGHIEQIGAPLELFESPATEYVASFLGSPRINLLSAPLPGSGAALEALWQTLSAALPHGTQKIGVRPQHVTIAPQPSAAAPTARIELIENLGDSAVVYLQLPGLGAWLGAALSADAARHYHPGMTVGVGVDADRVLPFAADGRLLARG